MVDAHSAVAPEGEFAVVPPRVAFWSLLEQSERICQTEVKQGLEVRTFFVGAVNGASQGDGIPHVQVVPRDVVVTHQHQFVVAGQFIFDKGLQGRQPRHFVNKFVAVGGLAVGEVRAHDTHTIHRGCDDTGHLVGETWDVVYHLGHRVFGNQRHTVVGFLTEEGHVVTSRFNLGFGKFVVSGFGFLQGQHIDAAVLGLCLTLGGSSLFYILIQRGAAASVTSLMYLVPPTTAVLALVLFGETMTFVTLIGILVTALGVSLVVRPPKIER